ncbi:MAG: gamma-glutamyltransferase [Mariprofundaceae bacterium]
MAKTAAGGMVAAGHPVTAEAGADILRAGGNAVDAAIGAVCAAFTAECVLTAAGGGGFLMLRLPDGKARVYDGFARMPHTPVDNVDALDFRAIPVDFGDTVQEFHIGRASIATPGLMAMLFEAQARHGCMPMGEVLQPAISAAKDGVRLNPLQASFMHLLKPILTATRESENLHAPEGKLPGEGDNFRNPNLANTLELLAIEGIDEMYHGDVARAIVAACSPGGLLQAADLEGEYAKLVKIRQPLAVDIDGDRFLTNPPPSSGGALIAFSLRLLAALRRECAHLPLPVLLAESLHAASLARSNGFDHKVYMPSMDQAFLSDKRCDQALQAALARLNGGAIEARAESANRLGSTTQISVIDADGMAVSLTSSNGEGSGIVVPGTGIHLNNMLGEADINPGGFHRLPAGETLSSMMAPSMFEQNGRLALVLGSGGSNRLRGAILQVLQHHIFTGMDIESAISSPRIHNESNLLDVEPDAIIEEDKQHLESLGWTMREWQQVSVYFGGVHAVSMDRRGKLNGAGDPRRGGAVAWA